MRKIVAVLGYGKKRQESTFTYPVDTINAGYASSIIKAGALPFLVPSTKDPDSIRNTVQKVDGILIPGGNDIDPFLYGESVTFADKYDRENDYFQLCMLEEAIKEGKPVMGICRGMQIINVFFGGTLYQDIEKQFGGDCFRHMQSAPGYNPTHFVTVEKGSFLSELLPERAKTNSFHHQCVKEPAPGFKITAKSDDGVPECIERQEGTFMMGVQWHPECLAEDDAVQMDIFRTLVEKAGS